MKRKIKQHLCTLAKLRLSASMSSTCHQAARSSPRWRPPDLEFQATLDDNFIGLESPLEVEILVSNLYTFVLSLCRQKEKTVPFWNELLLFYAITCLFGEKK